MTRDRVKSRNRFDRKAIAAVLRHHRQKPMLRYLEYLKSDSQPISEEERRSYRPPLKEWWFGKSKTFKNPVQNVTSAVEAGRDARESLHEGK